MEHVLTSEMMTAAIDMLNRDGSLSSAPPVDTMEGIQILDTKATTFLRQSREKGNSRTAAEHSEAYIMACFKLWLEGQVKLVEAVQA